MEDTKTYIVGIVREEKNKWERRVAVTPKEAKSLVEQGFKVVVQPSTTRCFTQKEYEDVGATFQEDLSECNVIIGVKEVPIENLIADKLYVFFSHIIKAQDYNMPLLDKMLELKVRLIDYECIRENGHRLVAFGRYAGIAGTVDFMRGIGEFLLEKKFQTFFVNIASTYMYVDLPDILESLTKVGQNIAEKGLPQEFAPYVFAVTSDGRVAQGALEILELFPHEYVDANKLDEIPKDDNTKIYITVLTQKDLVELKEGGEESKEFDKEHYYAHPFEYKSKFHQYYSKITFLVNCMYWEAKFPRVIIEEELIEQKDMKFLGFTDISADYEGSIEVTREFSEIENPFNLYCPKTQKLKSKISDYEEGDILYHCVDHLPAEMPLEASRHFGE
jgi:alpha-aminoadipic semialdehyde synthase